VHREGAHPPAGGALVAALLGGGSARALGGGLEWLSENWYIAWALFCLAIIVALYVRYRRTAPVRFLLRLRLWLAGLAICLALVGMLLMFIGSFTVEWTCTCAGPEHWECKGANCDAEANAHFEKTKHSISCTRTDWPMRILGAVGRLIIPE